MTMLAFAGIVYLLALFAVAGMMAAETIPGALFAGVIASALWVASMYLLFKGLVLVGALDGLVVIR